MQQWGAIYTHHAFIAKELQTTHGQFMPMMAKTDGSQLPWNTIIRCYLCEVNNSNVSPAHTWWSTTHCLAILNRLRRRGDEGTSMGWPHSKLLHLEQSTIQSMIKLENPKVAWFTLVTYIDQIDFTVTCGCNIRFSGGGIAYQINHRFPVDAGVDC